MINQLFIIGAAGAIFCFALFVLAGAFKLIDSLLNGKLTKYIDIPQD